MDTAPRKRILLVEDDPQLLDFFADLLQNADYSVTKTADGSEALRLLSNQPGNFEILVSDIDLPNVDGTRLADAAARRSCPVVLMSGKHEQRSIELPGGAIFLRKPFSAELLLSVVRKVSGS